MEEASEYLEEVLGRDPALARPVRPSDPCSSLPTTNMTFANDESGDPAAADEIRDLVSMSVEECLVSLESPVHTIAGAAAAELIKAASSVVTVLIAGSVGRWK